MAKVIDRIDIEPTAEPLAEPAAEPGPKVRFRGLKKLWNDYCNSQPCVQDFHAKLAAEERARAEERAESPPG